MDKFIPLTVVLLLIGLTAFAAGSDEQPAAEPAAAPEAMAIEQTDHAIPYNLSEYERMTGTTLTLKEAPSVAALVAQGSLPAIEDRLPEEPLVVKPVDGIGKYGGTLRLPNTGKAATNYMMDWGYEFLVSYTPDMARLFPRLIKGWDVSADGMTFTLHLREGMKWSDGTPFTADDLLFYFEDVALNTDLSPSPSSRMLVDGVPGVPAKVGEHTFQMTFHKPFGVFIENLARWRPNNYLPRHYLEQFHPTYTEMADIEATMKAEGYDTWVNLFSTKMGGHLDAWGMPERPVLMAWIPQNTVSEPVQVLERNPYYFMIDVAGNQLPYIDRMERVLTEDKEALLLKTIAGEFDYNSCFDWGCFPNHQLVLDSMERGNYRIEQHWWPPDNQGNVRFNFHHEDPVLGALFNDKRFRVAISLAINREDANSLVFKGLATPTHTGLPEGPPFHGENLFKSNLEFDPDQANALLDEIGTISDRDGDGFRLRPDGARLRLVNTINVLWPETVDLAELYKNYWKELGIEVVSKPIQQGMATATLESGQYDIFTATGQHGGRPMNPLFRASLVPISERWGTAPQWGAWIVSGGEKGTEPPEDLKTIMRLREEALASGDEQVRIARTIEIAEIWDANLWMVGGFNMPMQAQYWVVNNRIRNWPRNSNYNICYEMLAPIYIDE